jgi:hypothetical protein
MPRRLQFAATAFVFLVFLALTVIALPAAAVFVALMSVYVATTATLDAIVDQRRGCAALRRIAIRVSLPALLIATTLIALALGLAVWAGR